MIVAVIPAFNEAARIASVLRAIPRAIDRILVVDDGSDDGTKSVVEREASRDPRILILCHKENLGMGAAFRTGLLYASKRLSADVIVTLDADGEHDPRELSKMLEHQARDNADLVLGQRDLSLMPVGRRISTLINAGLINLASRLSVRDSQCGLRVFRGSLVQRLSLSGDGYEFATRFLIDVGKAKQAVLCIPITTIPPRRRLTQYRRAPLSIPKLIREVVRAALVT